jgi:hypothetical protein
MLRRVAGSYTIPHEHRIENLNKNICHVVLMILGLIVLPDNIISEKMIPWLPAMYPLHIQEAINYADISVNWL